MALRTKINRIKHRLFVKGIGAIGDKAITKVTKVPTFGVFGSALSKYDKGEAHKTALKKSNSRMKKNPKLTRGQLSDAYYKDRTTTLYKKGVLHGGILLQYFKKIR